METSKKNSATLPDERIIRLKKLAYLRDLGIDPYPAETRRSHTIAESLQLKHGSKLTVAGRLMTKRDMGKLTFAHVQDASGRIQIALKDGELEKQSYELFLTQIDNGDILEITGERFLTHKGEESILVKEWRLLAKAIEPLPDKYHGLNDEETRYRKRYLDFLVNPEQKEKIIIRGKLLQFLREFLQAEGFLEVETPVLETVASGAAAKPFVTHFNAYDLNVYLRIAGGELWQKRLMVAGFEKTFEMGRVFRNEGVDHQHNPEFTMLEYYWAYADARDNMRLHERMLPSIVEKTIGSLAITYEDQTIDFTPPYSRITFREAIIKHTGIDINDHASIKSLAAVMKKNDYEVKDGAERGKLLDSLYKQSARPKIIAPTFVLEYPLELKPLAKRSTDPRFTDNFQLVVNGFEISNSYTELNDPIDQKERFVEQARLAAAGEEEVMGADNDFVTALEHGMPPVTGTGIGIDRLVALLSNSHTIREVTAFPLMRPL